MDIYVLEGLEGAVDLISSYESLIWTVQYFSKNDFQLIIAASPEVIEALQVGRLLCRAEDVTEHGFKNVMIIESLQLDFDSERGWILTVKGAGLKSIVGRRVVWYQTTMSGTVEDAIRQVITENIISPSDTERAIDDFTLGAAQGFEETADIQLFGENIAEWLEATCQTYGYGWDVIIDNGKYVFQLYKGTDRSFDQNEVAPVVFSPEYDNLLSSQYILDETEYRNAALIGGEGEGTSKRRANIGTAEGLARYEAYIDGSGVSSNGEIITVEQYMALLRNYGQEQLSQYAFTEKFSGNIDASGMYVINRDYFLGDVVQVDNDNGIAATTRIIEIIYAIDENGSSVVPTFTEWEVDN